MGVLIILGVAVLVTVIYRRATALAVPGSFHSLASGPPALIGLGLPAGARIAAVAAAGDRLAVTVTLADGDRLYLIDPRTGAVAAVVATGARPVIATAPAPSSPP